MTALAMMRLIPNAAGRITSGEVLLEGQDLLALNEAAMRAIPAIGLADDLPGADDLAEPGLTVGDQIGEAVRLHQGLGRTAALARAVDMLDAVGSAAPGEPRSTNTRTSFQAACASGDDRDGPGLQA
jgi:ABC-type microcin C transport system duplicated ATPase subunit YejF